MYIFIFIYVQAVGIEVSMNEPSNKIHYREPINFIR